MAAPFSNVAVSRVLIAVLSCAEVSGLSKGESYFSSRDSQDACCRKSTYTSACIYCAVIFVRFTPIRFKLGEIVFGLSR